MSNQINLSIYGAYKYKPDIFDDLVIPKEINKDDLIANILMECTEMQLLFTDFDMLKDAIKYWSNSRISTWNRMAIVLYEDYEPFINIKRDETRTIIQDRDLNDNGTSKLNVNAWNDESTEREKSTIDNKQTGTITTTEHFHVEGDSAITDAQDVVRNEMIVRMQFELTNIIVNEFRNKFCLNIY